MLQDRQFQVTVTRAGDEAIVALRGELDVCSAELAWVEFRTLVADGATAVAIDLTELTFVDSRGIGVLVRTAQSLDGTDLSLRNPTPLVRRVLEVSGLADTLHVR